MGIANPKTGTRALEKAKRQEEALRLRLTGASVPAIARHMKIHRATVHKYIVSAIDEAAANTALSAEQLRQVELQKLDQLEAQARTMGPDTAIPLLLKIHDKRVRLLDLCAPVRHIHSDGTDELLLRGAPEGEALDRLRRARAEMAELELAQRRMSVIPLADVHNKFRLVTSHLARAADELRRRGNEEGLEILNAAIEAVRRDCQQIPKQIG